MQVKNPGLTTRVLLGVLSLLVLSCSPGRTESEDEDLRRDGGGSKDMPVPMCSGRACQVPRCRPGETTVLTGRVFAGNGEDPVPAAAVYVPTFDLPEIPPGVGCDRCNQIPASVAATTTAFDGSFRLSGTPSGSFPLVVQLGRFRRVVNVTAHPCTESVVPADPDTGGKGLRLSRKRGELSPADLIPRIAVASGDYDQIECVLARMGVLELDMYNGRDQGVRNPPSVAELSTLLNDEKKLLSYNILIVNCTDNQYQGLLSQQRVRDNLEKFVKGGGRLYATDWAYDVIEQVPQFAPYLCFEPQTPPGAPMCSMRPEQKTIADSRDPYGGKYRVLDMQMARWLALFPSVINNKMEVDVDYSFVMISKVAEEMPYGAKVWLDGPTRRGVRPQTVTFDYNQCGRVHFSTYNTEPNGVVDDFARWPANCKGSFSPQERLLEYLLFHIASCVGPLE